MRRLLQSLEEALARSLSLEDRGSVATLNDLPRELVDEARALIRTSRIATVDYLQFYVSKAELGAVAGFIDDVLREGGVPASDWGKRGVVCYSASDAKRLTVREESELLDPLREIEGERWLRVSPEPKEWDWSGIAGAPGVLVRSAPYWFEPPAAVEMGDRHAEDPPLEPVPDERLSIAVRRWVASRIAWSLRKWAPSGPTSIENICAKLGVKPEELSGACRAAIQGLLRSGWPRTAAGAVPGFDGPDDWYR